MPQSTKFARKVDPVIASVLNGYTSYFTKPEVVRDILKTAPNVNNVINQANLHAPSWGLDEVLKDAIEGRVTRQLQKKASSKKYGIRLRVYENYAVGHGPHRWQKLEIMSMADLQVCLQWRRAHVASEQAVITAYEKILDEMRNTGKGTVGPVL